MPRLHRLCIDCGKVTIGGRCTDCADGRYGGKYQAERKRLAPLVAVGDTPCGRCGGLIDGPWDLDHHPSGALIPAHQACNRSFGH